IAFAPIGILDRPGEIVPRLGSHPLEGLRDPPFARRAQLLPRHVARNADEWQRREQRELPRQDEAEQSEDTAADETAHPPRLAQQDGKQRVFVHLELHRSYSMTHSGSVADDFSIRPIS